MRQSSTITSSKAYAQSLHPLLQRAFACSDIQLDEELSRYRRQKALGKATYSPRPAAYRKAPKSLDLISTAPIPESSPSQQVTSNAELTLERSPATVGLNLAIAAVPEQANLSISNDSELKELAAQYAAQVADGAESALDEVSPDYYLESSELLRSLAAEEAEVQAEQSFLQSLLTPLGMGSMLLLLLSSAMFGFLVMNPASISRFFDGKEIQTVANSPGASTFTPNNSTAGMANAPQPNLASREFPDLSLQTLGSVEVAPTVSMGTPPSGNVGSPVKGTQPVNLGLSGNSTSTNGLTQSSEPVPISAANLRVAEPLPDAASSFSSSAPISSSAPSTSRVSLPKPSAPIPRYRPSAQPYRSAPAQSSALPAKSYVAPPVRFEPVKPELPTVAPAPTPSQQPAPVGELDYKVVTPYSSDRSLDEAQQKVPDAYLQNYPAGAKVQLGSFENEGAAKARVEQLRQQGVQAEIYKPEGIKP
ncbi:SPOR domain-containing protein [Phormidium sp. CLA17]|uniref:SPOR domain-containing protein n=1 Tax=Leptolyngbya sp. Cla-17 TaxID=2803751 RepID=UPI001491750D|nr:SPOR domain-containing protein [Leptolyngbya sp. Cla-17]MBM0743464.1 SPOR domain-containing protein [Leptolyngbya sp. Cla-17]